MDLELGGKGAKDAPTVPQMLMLNPIKNIYLLRQPCFGNLRVRQPLVRQPLVRQPLGGIPCRCNCKQQQVSKIRSREITQLTFRDRLEEPVERCYAELDQEWDLLAGIRL